MLKNYKLEKFPVVSSEGNEFLIAIKPCNIFVDVADVEVFSIITKRGLFGRERKKLRSVGKYVYDEISYEYDYVFMAKRSVEKVEERLRKEREDEIMRVSAIKRFESWDGKA